MYKEKGILNWYNSYLAIICFFWSIGMRCFLKNKDHLVAAYFNIGEVTSKDDLTYRMSLIYLRNKHSLHFEVTQYMIFRLNVTLSKIRVEKYSNFKLRDIIPYDFFSTQVFKFFLPPFDIPFKYSQKILCPTWPEDKDCD